ARPWLAFAATLLFAAHPIHVETVAYVTGRADLLATVCALGALLIARSTPVCAPGGCRNWRVWIAYALLAVAVLVDEVALVTPLLLLGLDRWGSPRIDSRGRTPLYWGFAAVAIAGLLARIGAHALHIPSRHELLSKNAGIWAAPIAAYEFLHTLIAPHALNAMRSLTSAEAASWALRISSIVAFVALAALIWARRKDPLARTGALLFALPLIPALPITPFEGAYVEERAAYFASVGFCFLVASLLAWLASRSSNGKMATVVLTLGLVGFAAERTLVRIPIWKGNLSLLSEAARLDPKDPAPQLALADQYLADANYGAALFALDKAVSLDSTNADAYHKRTVLLVRMEKYKEAEAAARKAVALDPKVAVFWSNLGDILIREGRIREAVPVSQKAVAIDSTNAENWYNYGVVLAAAGSLSPAVNAYRHAIAINPSHFQAVNNLGAVYAYMGRMADAKKTYEQAVELQPSSVQARMNLALASLQLGDMTTVEQQRDAITKLDLAAGRELVLLIEKHRKAQGTK
ncbi:MAG TPA: tetratricopeptide repeat protein, partial [Candidatus Eisenbacteria bacterium]|nr:tetratricopeptide repeat protein [Candidatus Eisenbacteria bacterium]